MTSDAILLVLFGCFIGAWVEDLVPGGLRAWANYESQNRQAKGVPAQGKVLGGEDAFGRQ